MSHQQSYTSTGATTTTPATTDTSAEIAPELAQSVVIIPKTRLFSAPIEIIEYLMSVSSKKKMIIFFPTTDQVILYSFLINNRLGLYRVYEIHSRLDQNQRTWTSEQFYSATTGILLTTDASARGMDYKNITHCIQFGIAENRDTYIHRAGRTARIGKRGYNILVLSPNEEFYLYRTLCGLNITPNTQLERLFKKPIFRNLGDELSELIANVRDSKDPQLANLIKSARTSMLSFYKRHKTEFGDDNKIEAVTQMVNSFYHQGGMKELPRETLTSSSSSEGWNIGDKFDVGVSPRLMEAQSNLNSGLMFGRWRRKKNPLEPPSDEIPFTNNNSHGEDEQPEESK